MSHPGFDGDFVFPNDRGKRLFNPSTIRLRAKPAWTKAGLQPITLHECRHTYAAYMIAAGINTKALSTYMGHSTITTTMIYVQISPRDVMEQYARAVAKRLLPAPALQS